jgi:hypothetical protein
VGDESGEGHQVSESLELIRKEKEWGSRISVSSPLPKPAGDFLLLSPLLARAVWCQNMPTWCRCSFACFFFTIVLWFRSRLYFGELS